MSFKRMAEMLKKAEREAQAKVEEFEAQIFEFNYQNSIQIKIKGNLEITAITIADVLIDPTDKVTLQEMVAEAVNEAVKKVVADKEELVDATMPKMPGFF